MMVPIIAWRNIWRNPTRSLVLISAIVIGIWSLIFILGFMQGVMSSYIRQAIESRVSHIQIHRPDFQEDRELMQFIPDPEAVEAAVRERDDLAAYSVRSLVSGMLSTSRGSYGVMLQGVDPAKEQATIRLREKLKEGSYPDSSMYNPLFVSEELAGKLKLSVGSKAVFQFQQADSEIAAAAFRVAGIYEGDNAQIDVGTAYALRSDLNRLALLDENTAHEIALLLNDISRVDTVIAELKSAFPDLLIRSFGEVSPDLELFQNQMQISLLLMTSIFMLALIFGIINTMLMAVLERVRELGMLMAIGMNRWRVFLMIVLETIFLALVAAPIGFFLGWRTIAWLGRVGLDLSMYSEGMQQFGMAAIVYPSMETHFYVQILIAVCLTAILGALYPAFKAIRLRPVEALRKI